LIVFALVIPLTLFFWATYALKESLLPPGVFAIGQGEQRYRTMLTQQRFVAGTVVALVVGLVVNTIWFWIGPGSQHS
jgi:hypothetical protein